MTALTPERIAARRETLPKALSGTSDIYVADDIKEIRLLANNPDRALCP
jgi:hypothetical protein